MWMWKVVQVEWMYDLSYATLLYSLYSTLLWPNPDKRTALLAGPDAEACTAIIPFFWSLTLIRAAGDVAAYVW